MVPLLAVPVLLLVALLLVAVRLRREPRHELIAAPARVRPSDPRVWPFLVAGFGMFTALGFIQVITGFIVQDRLGLDAETTGLVTGGALLAAGLGLGIAMPGYTAGPTLLVGREEQGGLAGLINANTGLTFVVAPAVPQA
jgi:hypothetical protein